MLIDAHQHFWTLGANECTWPTPDLAAIYRDFGPGDLKPLLARTGIAGTVLVQSQPADADTDWLLQIAAHEPIVKAVVGWADLKAADAPVRIAQLAAQPKLRGLRPMLQNMPEDDWILDPAVEPAIEAMQLHGLRFDALVFPRHLPVLLKFAQAHPRLPIVIDHGAKPPIARGTMQPWQDDMHRLAALPQVHCKLSGLPTEAGPSWVPESLAPYVAHLVKCFGSERVMWGSDWPVLQADGNYLDWHRQAQALIGTRDAGIIEAIFGGTARRFYGF